MSAKPEFFVNIVRYNPYGDVFETPGTKLECPIVRRYLRYHKCDRHFKHRLATVLPQDAFAPDWNAPLLSSADYVKCSPVAIIQNRQAKFIEIANPNTEWDSTIRDYGIQSGDTLYYQDSLQMHIQKFEFLRRLQAFALSQRVMIDISYNQLCSDSNQAVYDQTLRIDIESKLAALRDQLAAKLSLTALSCAIFVADTGKEVKELTDNSMRLSDCGLADGSKLYVQRRSFSQMIATLDDECVVNVYVQDEIRRRCLIWGYASEMFADDEQGYIVPEAVLELLFSFYYVDDAQTPLVYVGEVVLQKQWGMSLVKQMIFDRFYPRVPMANLMRIRNMIQNNLRGVYYDDQSLYENVRGGWRKQGMQICCQRTLSQEVLTRKHVLLKLVRCYVGYRCFGQFVEMSFSKKCRILTEFKEFVAELSGIDVRNIGVLRSSADMLQSSCFVKGVFCAKGVEMWEDDKLSENATLGGSPWFQRNGDIVVYVDKAEYNIHTDD